MFICIQTNYLKNTCLFAEKYQKSNGMLPPTPNIQPNHQSRWIWPSQHTTTQLQYALSWFASCYLSPMSALETLTIKTPKKKNIPKNHPLLGHLNATTFSQFLKTICAPGHRCITWKRPDEWRRFSGLKLQAPKLFVGSKMMPVFFFFEISIYIYIYIISYIEISIQVVGGSNKKLGRLRSPCLGTHPQPKCQ